MNIAKLAKRALAAAAMVATVGSAVAAPISVGFNFIGFGTFTGNTGDITTSTAVNFSGPNYLVNGIDLVGTTNNINVTLGQQVFLTDPMPLTLGATFSKSFTTSLGSFVESLTIDSVTVGTSSRSITAVGTIDDGAGGFDPTTVYFSASYTQNGGPSGQINASFNNSTVPPPPTDVPEPASLALVGLALLGTVAARRRKA